MKKWLGLVLLTLLLAGCGGSVEIRSNWDASNHVKYNRILLSLKSHEQTEDLFSGIQQQLDSLFTVGGITVKDYKPDALSLDNSDMKSVVKDFGPDGALFLSFERGTTINGRLDKLTILGAFYNMSTDKSVWKASIDVTPAAALGFNDNVTTAHNIAVAIVRKMHENGLINKIVPDEGS